MCRLTGAREWAHLSITHNLPQSLTTLDLVIDLISQVAGMHRTIEQRHTDLIDILQLTTVAVAAAFAQGQSGKALEWLEQGRCLIWSQLNQLRTPVDNLREHNENLAQRFLDISGALESSGSRGRLESLGVDVPMLHKMTLQAEAHTHIKVAHEWSELLDEIRETPKFHNFLRPPRASELLKSLPKDGPIILINTHQSRCDALALIYDLDEPIHIPLPSFSHTQASNLKERLRNFLVSKRVRTQEVHRAGRPVQPYIAEMQSEIHFVLKELWVCVVRPILDCLAYSVSLCQSIEYTLADLIRTSAMLRQNLAEFGGVQLVRSRSSHFTPQGFTAKMSFRHLDLVSRPLQSPHILQPSVRSLRSSRGARIHRKCRQPAYSLSVNRKHQVAPQSQARRRR